MAKARRSVGVSFAIVGVVLANFALYAGTQVWGRPANPHLPPADATHVSQGHEKMQLDRETNEVESPEIPPPTRSSFMASWRHVAGATSYRLDVAIDRSFTRFVKGYHDLDVGNVLARSVNGLSRGTTYYYRVRAYDGINMRANSEAMTATTAATAGLIIHPYFDSSITTNPNAAAIEAMINRCVAIYESLFSDPVTINILFRYATTIPGGSPFPSGAIAYSRFVIYSVNWFTYVDALRADAKTNNDAIANASLPGSAISTYIRPGSAGGRALGLNTPPAMYANGSVVTGGPYDGIVTLNSAKPYKFTRPASAGFFDAQRTTEHEMDEVIGLGSRLGGSGNDLRPQDLFSWSSPNVRNLSSNGTRYFSINRGGTNIVNFNQDPDGDFGDWLSGPCPQAHPYVQNAFSCTGQYSDVTPTSAEGINLDVVGYNLVDGVSTPSDFNNDAKPDYVLYNATTRQTVLWYLNNSRLISGVAAPTLPPNWRIADVADFNIDGHPDYALFNPSTRQTAIWYLVGAKLLSGVFGPTLPTGWQLVGTADFNSDGRPDYVLYNPTTRQTALWYMNTNVRTGSAVGPTLPAGWSIVGVADFNRDGKTDYLLYTSASHQSQIFYLSGGAFLGARSGPTIAAGFQLIGTSDFNADYKPDYLLFNPSTRQTAIWYLNDNVFITGVYGPTPPGGWTVAAP
jgi:hypothetical protein